MTVEDDAAAFARSLLISAQERFPDDINAGCDWINERLGEIVREHPSRYQPAAFVRGGMIIFSAVDMGEVT